ncbi:MAG: hypothetical protein A3I05_02590 [Deltaproteobacteria bacterium RIFCSPLOWO2_02_FULL_44_10]|nr:MAG: hypothetical protein A3C46_01540 [Deltaproteobacteria bacterium RIFCSPHIGHO2_02_FULL_44_16]OGQ45725.1 MAG: hypothetical protein A3I05_02590 [Deltaproteobacteria bacterium RIFCSPLOWO2_02_FULL_44_10]
MKKIYLLITLFLVGYVQHSFAAITSTFNQVSRTDFNRISAELSLPLFWSEDRDHNNAISPDEVAVLWGITSTTQNMWIVGTNKFSPEFLNAYQRIVDVHQHGHAFTALPRKEVKRRNTVLKELAQSRPTLVATNLTNTTSEDQAIVKHILEAAKTIEKLYAMQQGVDGLAHQIPEDDTMSHTLFYRNQTPWCVASQTESDKNCNALPTKPKKISGLYPKEIQKKKTFCETLEKNPDNAKLLHQFAVVKNGGGSLTSIPYHQAYAREMQDVSISLQKAAQAITSKTEQPFKHYLLAASQAFLDDSWEQADEAWAKMNAENSKWYLRIAPDEVYFEPCSRKAGFHVSFARINQASLQWQRKLDPLKQEMEQEFAERAGEPYTVRKVSFHLPDFIDIVVNAGDARSPQGATVGQSLPNWGPVANEGRGRTVVMSNLYTDADSIKSKRDRAESLFCAASMESFRDDETLSLMKTILHEASHNLGPSHEYRAYGKTDDEAFGGPLASMLEELKAETGGLYFVDWLRKRNIISEKEAHQSYNDSVQWMFRQLSREMYTSSGKPRPYTQLAAIQFGHLLKNNALTWNSETLAANGKDKGCLELHLDQFPEAVHTLMETVAGIKGRGDKDGAKALQTAFVDNQGSTKKIYAVIKERNQRTPKTSFVYAVKY